MAQIARERDEALRENERLREMLGLVQSVAYDGKDDKVNRIRLVVDTALIRPR